MESERDRNVDKKIDWKTEKFEKGEDKEMDRRRQMWSKDDH